MKDKPRSETGWYCIREHNCPEKVIYCEDRPPLRGSQRGPFPTKEECLEKCGILPDPCRECGGVVVTTYCNKADLIKYNLCFHCDHWRGLVLKAGDSNSVRVKHRHYQIGPETGPKQWRGHGGSKFIVRFNDGREVVSTDLWHQGTIPEYFWDRLPDNAEFVN